MHGQDSKQIQKEKKFKSAKAKINSTHTEREREKKKKKCTTGQIDRLISSARTQRNKMLAAGWIPSGKALLTLVTCVIKNQARQHTMQLKKNPDMCVRACMDRSGGASMEWRERKKIKDEA